MNICDSKEIPYINIYLDEDAASKSAVLNMYPNLDSLTQLLLDHVNVSNWKSVTILYESPLWLRRVAKCLEFNKQLKNRINMRNLDYTTDNEFRPTLQDIRDSDDSNIILLCSFESLPIILRQAMQVGLMTKHYRWIITNLDAHSINLEPYQYSGANITTFRLLNINHAIFDQVSKNVEVIDDGELFDVDPDSKLNTDDSNENNKCQPNVETTFPTYPDKFSGKLKQWKYFKSSFNFNGDISNRFHLNFFSSLDVMSLRAALIYDAVMIFATAIQQLGSEQVTTTFIRCDNVSSVWTKGYTILNYMKNVNFYMKSQHLTVKLNMRFYKSHITFLR